MRSWSEELVQDRKFEIGGEHFEWVYPHWEIGAKLFDDDLEPAKNGDKPDEEAGTHYFQTDTKLAIDRIPLFLNPKNEAVKRWKALCARKTDPVPRFQLIQLYQWLVQVTGGLPTSPPSEPVSGGGDSDSGSSDVSSWAEATSTT